MKSTGQRTGWGVAGLLAAVLAVAARAQTAPEAAPLTAPEVTVTLQTAGKEPEKVVVSSVDGTRLFYRLPSQPAGVSISVPVASLERFDFELTVDQEELNRALMAQNWNQVCAQLWPVISPVLPYLPVRNNNGIDRAMVLGNALVKVARAAKESRAAGAEEKASLVYKRAYGVFGAVTSADWSPDADVARLKAILCLVALNQAKLADKELKKVREPETGDQTVGLYWYVQALLREAQGDRRAALEAVVRSVVFENKDIDTFPDALMLSGRLYEALLEPYRARDVYYEVARLFAGTEWGAAAKARLQYLLDQRLTEAKEGGSIEKTFFGLDEDVNAKATALLQGTLDREPPEAEMSLDEEPETGKPAAGKTGKGSGE